MSDKVVLGAFDNEYQIFRDCKAKDWKNLTNEELQPRGTTALYDSCGKIMTRAEEDNAKKTVLVVMTDGYENASKEHTQASIKAKVKQFEDKLLDMVIKDLKRGKTEKEIKDLVIKMFTEFYGMMYQQRTMWQSRLRNA